MKRLLIELVNSNKEKELIEKNPQDTILEEDGEEIVVTVKE